MPWRVSLVLVKTSGLSAKPGTHGLISTHTTWAVGKGHAKNLMLLKRVKADERFSPALYNVKH
jgi:hypothetical protein